MVESCKQGSSRSFGDAGILCCVGSLDSHGMVWIADRRPTLPIVIACSDRGDQSTGRGRGWGARDHGVRVPMMSEWRHEFAEAQVEGQPEVPRPGTGRSGGDRHAEISAPTDACQWLIRYLDKRRGTSHETRAQIWQAFGIELWPLEKFKLSSGPIADRRVCDVPGQYLAPATRSRPRSAATVASSLAATQIHV